MLHLLRRAAKTWVFKALFALLIVSFAVWGIGDVSIGGAGNRVARVGDEEVTVSDYALALQREMQSLSRQMQRRVTMEEAEAAGIPRILLARLARDAALNAEAKALGVSADDAAVREAILASPSFQGLDGRFDKQQYEFILNQLGFEVGRFENDMRRSLARDLVASGVAGGAEAAPGYAEIQLGHRLEQRDLAILTLDAEGVEAPEPTDAELRAWHEAHAGDYVAPERRDIVWIAVDPAGMVDQVEIPEDELRAAYDAAESRFNRPERRVIDRIAFPDTEAAMAAKAEIESGGKDFADIAGELGLTLDDASMGEVTRAALPANEAEAAFAGELGVKGPVATGLGPALLNVRAILPAETTSFEEARDTLRAELAEADAADLAARKAEQVADLIAGGATLEEIASETGLALRSAGGVTAAGDGVEGLAATPEFIAEAFAAEPGEERDLIELPGGGWAALRVESVADAAPMTFAEAREQVAEDWRDEKRMEVLRAEAETIAAALEAGEAADAVAETSGADFVQTGLVTREVELSDVPAKLIEALFAAETGAPASAEGPGVVAVGVATEVRPADLDDPTYAQIAERWRAALNESVGRDLNAYHAQAVQQRLGVTVNESAMRQVINQLR